MNYEPTKEPLTNELPAYTPPCATRMKDLSSVVGFSGSGQSLNYSGCSNNGNSNTTSCDASGNTDGSGNCTQAGTGLG
jgi:hypothetical protein